MVDPRIVARYRPGFVISAGTQVVLRVSKEIFTDARADDARADLAMAPAPRWKKAGSVGVVMACPDAVDGPYRVQFADGEVVEARGDELVLRRQEVDELLAARELDLRPFIFYRCQVGSKAFGLATDASDDDLRGIYLPPARWHWSLYRLPEQLEFADGDSDEVYWELEKFLRLALKANPNVLETLWTPRVLPAERTIRVPMLVPRGDADQAVDLAEELRRIRRAFLSKHLYKTYSGYVLSQFRRMATAQDRTGGYKPKQAMHLVRLLYSGIAALRTGDVLVDVGPHRDELLAIRAGEWTFDEVRHRALALDREFQQAFEQTALPEQPDFATVDDFLCRARHAMVEP